METLKRKGGVKMAQVSNDTTIGEALFMNPESTVAADLSSFVV